MLGRKLGTGCQLKYSDELLISNMDTVNLLQHRIEAMAGGFIPTSVLTPNADLSYQECSLLKQTLLMKITNYRALLQKGRTVKITVGSHEIIPNTGGNITSVCNTRMVLSMQPSYDRSRRPAGMNDIMLGRKMGKGCQLKYADFPMSKRLTINKFAEADKKALTTCDTDSAIRMHRWQSQHDTDRGIHVNSPIRVKIMWCRNNEGFSIDSDGIHSSMLPAKQFPLSQHFFKEYLADVRDTADKDAGYVYKESCHTVNLDVSKRQSLLLWPLWGECPSIFWNSLKMATARAKVMHQASAIVHCDYGHTKSGGENVHTANTAKRNVTQDEAMKPAEMVDLDGRILRPPEYQENYVDSEDENVDAMMLANKTENAKSCTYCKYFKSKCNTG
jgi:hypothetical protein